MFIDVSGQSNGAREGLAGARAAEHVTAANSSGEHEACYMEHAAVAGYSGGLHWRPLCDEGGLRLRHSAVVFLPDV